MRMHHKLIFIKRAYILLLIIVAYSVSSFAEQEMGRELNYADKQLNLHYQKIISWLRPSEIPKLRKAQHQWILFRDLDCRWAFKQEPEVCMLERTKKRTEDFKEGSYYYIYNSYSANKKLGGHL